MNLPSLSGLWKRGSQDAAMPEASVGKLEEAVIEALRGVQDPEIPLNIYDLGLIYRLEVNPDGEVAIDMTLTAPACPVAGSMPGQVKAAVEAVPGVNAAQVELVWYPPWTQERLSEAAKLELGLL
jgi:FeS assembly SUF system protein